LLWQPTTRADAYRGFCELPNMISSQSLLGQRVVEKDTPVCDKSNALTGRNSDAAGSVPLCSITPNTAP
jgi:hypothetical protein